jgi:hypothetical protein
MINMMGTTSVTKHDYSSGASMFDSGFCGIRVAHFIHLYMSISML